LQGASCKISIHEPVKGPAAWPGVRLFLLLLLLMLAGAALTGIGSGEAVSNMTANASVPEAAADRVYVTNISLDPAVFAPYDKGTIQFDLTNGGTQAVSIHRVTLYEDTNTIRKKSDPYATTFTLGPGATRRFSFPIEAHGKDGFYYPRIYVDFRDAGSISQRVMVQVDNTSPDITVLDTPDTFGAGRKAPITLSVANRRSNLIKDVLLETSSPNASVEPARYFLGEMRPGNSTRVNLNVTPEQNSSLRFLLRYTNGYTAHTMEMNMSMDFKPDRLTAEPLVSNIQIVQENGTYHVSGDVNNAGLEKANSVTITALSPATPVDPYQRYAVGALNPDDFSSFELTFSAAQGDTVPLQVSYKDADGNIFTAVQNVSVPASAPPKGLLSGMIVPAAGVLGLVVVVGAAIVLYRRRRSR
ncbi:MAG TPA: hypothetical protein VE134_09045, partial [Methanomicrobiales archaeon]|nr:hypothetical protein [Methanomicrobiales archaeon]